MVTEGWFFIEGKSSLGIRLLCNNMRLVYLQGRGLVQIQILRIALCTVIEKGRISKLHINDNVLFRVFWNEFTKRHLIAYTPRIDTLKFGYLRVCVEQPIACNNVALPQGCDVYGIGRSCCLGC